MRLWESKHPYYCTEGCYYVSHTLGSRSAGSYDGNTCHVDYASWADFKAGDARPLDARTLDTRRAHGIVERTKEEIERQRVAFGPEGFHDADDDYNLLYRWDWSETPDAEYDPSDYGGHGRITLSLFYMLQRKARPQSVRITVTREDEPEIRAWLADKWRHMMRLWAPLAPDIEPGAPPEAVIERACLFYGGAKP